MSEHAHVPLTSTEATPLSERDARILDFERQWWRFAGAKEDSRADLFQMSATEYYQVLNALIDSHSALAHDPMLVKRLRRMRASRQRGRARRSPRLPARQVAFSRGPQIRRIRAAPIAVPSACTPRELACDLHVHRVFIAFGGLAYGVVCVPRPERQELDGLALPS